MNRLFLKYLLLSVFLYINIDGFFYMNTPVMSLLRLNLIIIFIPLLIKLIIRSDNSKLLMMFFFFVLFQYVNNERLPYLPDIFPFRLVLILIVMIFIFKYFILKQESFLFFTSTELLMVIMSWFCIFSMILSGTFYSAEEGLTLVSFLNAFGIPFLIFTISKNIVNDEKKLKNLSLFFIIMGAYLGLTGIFEHLHWWRLVYPKFIADPDFGIGWGRTRGPFGDSTSNGLALGMIFFIATYHYYYQSEKWKKLFIGVSIPLILASLIFCLSRSAWLGTFIGSLLFFVYLPKVRKAFIAGYIVIIIFASIWYTSGMLKPTTEKFSRQTTLSQKITNRTMTMSPIYRRIYLYSATWKAFLDNPVIGTGYGTFKTNIGEYFEKIEGIPYDTSVASHNSFTAILVETGLAGFSVYTFIYISIFIISLKLYHILPTEGYLQKKLIVMFWAILIIYLVTLQFIEMRRSLFHNSFIFLFAGITCGFYQRISLKNKFNL